MTRSFHAWIVLVGLLAVSCGRPAEVSWKDGNFKVYATDSDFNATKLGYDHQPGMLGIVQSEVVAAGSTAQLVFVKRIDRVSGLAEFYIVPKEESVDSHSGNAEGPFSEAQFRDLRTARQLPDFTWKKK